MRETPHGVPASAGQAQAAHLSGEDGGGHRPPLQVTLRVNGKEVTVGAGTIVAGAIARAGVTRFRSSVLGRPRGPLCGMGICMECCVTINGREYCRSCQTLCEPGMEVRTDE